MDEFGAKKYFWLVLYRVTLLEDSSGGLAEVEKVVRVEMDDIGANTFLG